MNKFAPYYNAVNFLENLSNLPRDNDYMTNRGDAWIHLEKTRILFKLLGNPQKNFNYIHITGTSGKGTVANLIHSALTASGKKAGLFTSPFTTTTIEKFKINNLYINPLEFAKLVEYLKPFIDKANLLSPWGPLSYFEIIFALAIVYFKKHHCKWVVLEVGCGGRFDATNIIPAPVASVLTNIGFDHAEILGKTLKKIAFEKAGIIKKNSNFWTTEQRPHLLEMFKKICKKEKAIFHWIKNEKQSHSILNKQLARSVCEKLNIKNKHIVKGFKKAFMPCRFEIVQKSPLVILDGAHNGAKIASTTYGLKKEKYKKLHLIFALANNKEASVILKKIIPMADYVYLTRFEMARRKCADPVLLFKLAKKIAKPNAKHGFGYRIFLFVRRFAQKLASGRMGAKK
ncbi:MAG: Mur ligase family protein [Candidatus Doudnabacteria bacterium]|nr:Mur ligase family protein [Candidatus Doudnabacteria bacterium]